ncbi:P1-P2 fusion protein [Groundnut rosette assistor virus]|uniref:P1-P2 fusion protein n=1 Tax=Groundnut rosette assistor virus TaxID=33761 RepID=A0AAE6R2N8_9VIRU|nr:P1-P2 fusion protein [Groundnut rosette assistor virus]QGY99242.1 P1-P2 fusion protein [Groundnut rosette assistor virus]
MNYFLSCVLFFSFFLLFQTSSNGAPISRGGTLIPTIYLDGLLGFNTSLLWEGKAAPGACTCPKTQLLTEHTYTELLRATWLKGSYDSLSLMQSLGDGLLAGSTCLLDESRKWASLTLEWFIWAVLALYFSIIWRTICIVLGLIFNHSLLIFATGLAVTSSVLVGWVLRKIFAILQMSILSALIPLTRGIWNLIRMRKRTTKEIGERAVDGFLTFKVRQDPPKKSVLQIQYSSGSHAGYATCIRLLNGRNALITAAHVVDPKQGPVNVVSPRTGNKIPWSEFQKRCVLCSTKNDQVICEGPPEWESLLGCKGVHFVPATNVSKSKCSLFALGDDGWYLRNAELAGAEFLPSGKPTGYMTLLCNTEAGDSGAPLFSGKSLVGVHIGYHLDLNSNRACPILPMRGVTLPDYVCETTAPTGRIFDQELIDMVSAAVKDIRKAEESLKAKAGRLWADEVEFEDEYFEAKPRFSNRKRSGKREARHRPRNNRRRRKPGLAHPDRRYDWKVGPGPSGEGSSGQDLGQGDRGGSHQRAQGESLEEGTAKKAVKQSWEEQAHDLQQYLLSLYNWEVCPPSDEGTTIPGFTEVGKLPKYYHPSQKRESEWGWKIIREYPEMGEKTRGFGWPQFGSDAELKSLRLQASRWLERAQLAEKPSLAERERVIRKTVEAYASVKTSCPTVARSGSLNWQNFLVAFQEAVSSLELDAGVGVPYIALGKPTHRSFVEDPTWLPVLARLTFARLQKIAEARFEEMTPVELVQHGLCDPIRLFVKGEPHKQAKLDEGRYRLIMSVSLVDQLVARVLFQDQNKREIKLWRSIPSKPGFGLSTDEQVLSFTESLAHRVGVPATELITEWNKFLVPTDCSGFDWSVADWMLEDDMEVRNRLTMGLNPLLVRLRAGWLKCIANSVLCTSDGHLLSQTVPGVQKSGSYNTSSSNSRIRVMCAFHCGASWAVAMGDDALESVDSNLAEYKKLGLKVEVGQELEFCSNIFKQPNLATPVNVYKMLYKLIHGYNPECGNLEVVSNYLSACFSVFNELRHSPDLVAFLYDCLVRPVAGQNNQ